MNNTTNIISRVGRSLAFKIGSAIVFAEIFVLVLTGILYVNNFSSEIDRRITGQVQLPGKLMQAGLLKFDSIADDKTMHDLVGEELINGLVVGTNQNIFYALNPALLGKNVADIADIDTSLLKPDITTTSITERDQKYISISPLFGTDKRTLRFYVYVEASTTSAQAQKSGLIRLFLLGSVGTVVLTFVILYVTFNFMVFSKLRGLLAVLKQAENGDLTARIGEPIAVDEIGVLQHGVNSMIGRLQAFVGTLEQRVQDRTQELVVARQVAESASNTKSVFLSNMSHELRTPLNMVIGYASSMLTMPQMYKNQTLPSIFHDDLQLIQDNGKYLLGLINDILDLSKIEAEKLTLDLQPVNLSELFRGVIATSLGLVKDKPLQITPDFPDDLPIVWGDPLRVRQILLNLMSNAIKFTDSGRITLSAKRQGNQVHIAVIDTGVGIPGHALSTIFDRYEQIKNNAEGKHTGTGLGLDISQRLCHMHNTQLTVTSILGQGSTFAFELMCATPEQMATSTLVTPEPESSVKLLNHSDFDETAIRQIVIAEGNSDLRVMLRQTLENANQIVVETSDGTQLIALVQGVLPDAIVSSVPLPSVDIWEVLETLKSQPDTAEIPVILLGDPSYQSQAEKLGFTFLSKPVNGEALLTSITHLFEKAKLS
ncbi:MAG: ATP-binding protein [Chloroflexota bacterium]